MESTVQREKFHKKQKLNISYIERAQWRVQYRAQYSTYYNSTNFSDILKKHRASMSVYDEP